MNKLAACLLLPLLLSFSQLSIASEISLTNLALGQQAMASSEEEPARAAVDGNPESYWQSAGMVGNHWLEISLDREYDIDRIVLPLVKGADSLLAEVWEDEKWVVVGSLPKDNPMIAFEPVKTQKIRLRSVHSQLLKIYEIQVFAYDPQPVFVNQVGYDQAKTKRFTAPLAKEGTSFSIVKEGEEQASFEGTIQSHIGDFSEFKPDAWGSYQVIVQGEAHSGRSVPFWIADGLIEQVSYQPAINFMVDVRCWFGDSQNYTPTDESADCPNLGVAWRDSHQFSFEIPSLLNLYFANPSAFSTERMPVQGMYLGVREELPENTPEIIRLIYWAVDIYLRGEVNHTLLKEQLAYFLYAYPYLDEYIPQTVYEEARDYLFPIWGDEAINRWQWHDIEHNGNLFQVYDFIGTGKGQFPPGHSIVPNLMMYEVAKREGREDADQYFEAAYAQTEWLLENLDWQDPRTTKGQRQGEHATLTALAYFLENYPKQAPKGISDKMESWADEMIRRSDNMWDYRRYSDDKWIIPSISPEPDPRFDIKTGFNEVGNIAGFPAPALAVAAHLESAQKQARLEEMAIAYVDHIFGRNPTGRHFGFDAVTDFDGVEMGWYKEWQGGAGILQTARGVLDGNPKETTYPYDPYAGDPGHTEGWVTFNTAWNTGLAYLSSNSIAVKVYDQDFSEEINKAKKGETIGIELNAPLNFDNSCPEKAEVLLHINHELIPLTLTETGNQSTIFRTEYLLEEGLQQKELKISYGYGWHEKQQTIRLR
ncbi:discoidin domain-containing protein [Catalinimonas sp. 4WD22]|uniref:discoidin domain-containing protein n=1 Tax=Catalinimonas locisalis TaxID=3133978 RepID=UPI0031011DB4